MKKQSLTAAIACGFCAAIWTVRAILDLVYQTYVNSPWTLTMNLLCAAVWTVAFVVNLNRYRADRHNQ